MDNQEQGYLEPEDLHLEDDDLGAILSDLTSTNRRTRAIENPTSLELIRAIQQETQTFVTGDLLDRIEAGDLDEYEI